MPAQKRKPKPAAKPATSAWRVKSVASSALTHVVNHAAKKPVQMAMAKPATTHHAVKVVANVPHVAKVAVNAHRAKMTQAKPKPCHLTRTLSLKTVKRLKPMTTVASAVNAVHATATAVTAANAVASALSVVHAKKVTHQRPTTAAKPPTKPPSSMRKTSVANAPPAKRVPHVKTAHLAKIVRLVVTTHIRPRKSKPQSPLLRTPHQPLPAACRRFKRLLCLCLNCTPLPKAAVWNG